MHQFHETVLDAGINPMSLQTGMTPCGEIAQQFIGMTGARFQHHMVNLPERVARLDVGHGTQVVHQPEHRGGTESPQRLPEV
jgi:hypothetical protein